MEVGDTKSRSSTITRKRWEEEKGDKKVLQLLVSNLLVR